jgi:hypothetical protein
MLQNFSPPNSRMKFGNPKHGDPIQGSWRKLRIDVRRDLEMYAAGRTMGNNDEEGQTYN